MKKRALLSVSDKRGIVELARDLVDLGYEVLSTGGTRRAIEAAGVAVTPVADATGFPEILDGRVKTLHPVVHGGILARRTSAHLAQLAEHDIRPIDVVAVNLYPFESAVSDPDCSWEDAIENIDIGGPTMVRSAAKNHADVNVLVDPDGYGELVDMLRARGETTPDFRKRLALKAFSHTARYDALISSWLSARLEEGMPEQFTMCAAKVADLRYGENPHQKAAFYTDGTGGLAGARQLGGKALSFNNIMDLQAAVDMEQEFDQPACVIIKHTNPCGAALGEDPFDAYQKAYACDPVSAFGSIVGLNRQVDERCAKEITRTFVEAVVAPSYTDAAIELLREKKNLRIMEMDLAPAAGEMDVKKVAGGFLVQDKDRAVFDGDIEWATQKTADESLHDDLLFAWKMVKHVKSNAILLVKNGATVGIGPGQTNRVGAARIALEMAGDEAEGSVMASDAFFPFRDTVDLAADYGVVSIIQPGGSVRDEDSITACDELGLSMAFTGMRHFKH